VNSLEQKQEEHEKDETVIDHGLKIHMGSGPGALSDPRNADLLAWVGDRLLPREQAKVSVFDSAVQGGDAVWEGLRVYDGRVFKLEEHLQRLADSAKAMDFKHVPTTEYIRRAVFRTLAANAMRDDAHIRLTLTRGAKITSSMNPAFNIFGTNLIILPEWKPVGNAATYDNSSGIKLITAANRRNGPQCVDSKIHHCNLINNSESKSVLFSLFVLPPLLILIQHK
jgi:branched-subunit amino acid aminotransferase/4-amino-4-deoxychorismate lyase